MMALKSNKKQTNRLIKVQIILLLCIILFSKSSSCQSFYWRTDITKYGEIDTILQDGSYYLKLRPQIYIDSLVLVSSDYKITHYHFASDEIEKKLRLDTIDEVFSDSGNSTSRLIFHSLSKNRRFNIPTIPLTNIIYLDNLGIIIGFTKIDCSPYNVVIYSTEGKLLSKRSLKSFMFKLKKKDLQELLKYRGLSDCLTKTIIVKNNDDYLVEFSRCMAIKVGKNPILNIENTFENPDFPSSGPIADGGLFKKYGGLFSDSDPLNDLIMIGSVPYLLILNSEDGKKFNIPLLSNCDIIKDLEIDQNRR